MKSLPNLVLDGLKNLAKQTRACETKLKQPQNEPLTKTETNPNKQKEWNQEEAQEGRTLVITSFLLNPTFFSTLCSKNQ